MIVKIVTLFLIAIAVLAMFGRYKPRLPGRDALKSKKCRHCGRYRIGKGSCPCQGGGR